MLIRLQILQKFHITDLPKWLHNFFFSSKISVTFYKTSAQEWKSVIETTIFDDCKF